MKELTPDKFVNMGLLFDYYGELLTAHQREIYEDAVYNDLSLAEIAEKEGTSRQSVHDLLTRCTKKLNGYEEKLGLIARDREIRALCEAAAGGEADEKARRLAEKVLTLIDG